MFDFSKVAFINPLVIPNILIVGLSLKEYFENEIDLYIPWKPDLQSYLTDIGFLNIVRENKLFKLDEEYIGGYTPGRLNNYCNTFIFDFGTTVGNIRYELNKSIGIIEKALFDREYFSDESKDNLLRVFTEIVDNACKHSESPCIVSFQVVSGNNFADKKAYISISDGGIGYYKSLVKKIDDIPLSCISKNDFIRLNQERNMYGIIEAIFYRQNYKVYGLNTVMRDIICKNGIVRIHSVDTQLIFTNNNFGKIIDNPKDIESYLKVTKEKFNKGNISDKYSNYRQYNYKLKGVHIEFEIPMLSGGSVK
jgi:hypothetical protein